jgi:hypothetical protein
MAKIFENKTIKEIRELLLNAFQEKFNTKYRLLPKSFLKVLCTILAGLFIVNYKLVEWVFLQIFPDLAYWGEVNMLGHKIRPLVKWGVLIGVGEPETGTQWKGIATIKVITEGEILIAGTQLKSDITGKLYLTEESVKLENETVTVPVIAAEKGAASILDVSDTLNLVSPLGFMEKTLTVTEIIEYAIDNEQEKEYRARVSQRFRAPPMGGALADYRKWSNEVSGVWNSYPQQDETTPNGVLIWIAGRPDIFTHRIPDDALLRRVGNSCLYDPVTKKADRKPVTACIDPAKDGTFANIRAVGVLFFAVKVFGLTGIEPDDFFEPCKTALNNYFLSREPYIRGLSDDNNRTDVISRNSILSVTNQVAVSLKGEFSRVEVLFNGEPIHTFSLVVGVLCEMLSLNIYAEEEEI